MTYLVPDDWYANHNLAPGDARLPQKPMQPEVSYSASKGLQPTPPMRGYFGPRPPQPPPPRGTVSPYAVSDVMWGINGLGAVPGSAIPVHIVHRPGHFERQVASRTVADILAASVMGLGTDPAPPVAPPAATIQAAANAVTTVPAQANPTDTSGLPPGQAQAYANADAVVAAAQKKIKMEMEAAAATAAVVGTTIIIALNCVPVIGQVVAAVFSIVSGISMAHYKNAAAKVMADLQNTLTTLATDYTVRQQKVLDAVFAEETPAAIQLALSGQPLAGLGDFWSKLKVDSGKALKFATSPASQAKALLKLSITPVSKTLQLAAKIVPSSVGKQLLHVDAVATNKAMTLANKAVQAQNILTGEDILDQARAASDKAIADFKVIMDKQLAAATANATSEAYRAALRVVIAKALRNNPDVGSLVTDQVNAGNASAGQLLAAQNVVDDLNSPFSKFLTVAPGIAAAGAAMLFLGARH